MIAAGKIKQSRTGEGLNVRRRYVISTASAIDSKKIQDKLQDSQVGREQSLMQSEFLSVQTHLEGYQHRLASILAEPYRFVDDEGSAPNAYSVETALEILKELLRFGVSPDSVTASADGGIAIIFSPCEERRAYLEIANTGEQVNVQYDLSGKAIIEELNDLTPLAAARRSARFIEEHLKVLVLASAV